MDHYTLIYGGGPLCTIQRFLTLIYGGSPLCTIQHLKATCDEAL